MLFVGVCWSLFVARCVLCVDDDVLFRSSRVVCCVLFVLCCVLFAACVFRCFGCCLLVVVSVVCCLVLFRVHRVLAVVCCMMIIVCCVLFVGACASNVVRCCLPFDAYLPVWCCLWAGVC